MLHIDALGKPRRLGLLGAPVNKNSAQKPPPRPSRSAEKSENTQNAMKPVGPIWNEKVRGHFAALRYLPAAKSARANG